MPSVIQPSPTLTDVVQSRTGPGLALLTQAGPLAHACRAVAAALGAGGRLLLWGTALGAMDALHVAVEFVHPVIVGKRALPAVRLDRLDDVATLLGPDDVLMLVVPGREAGESAQWALALAESRNSLTVVLTGNGPALPGRHVLRVESDDPLVVRELHVTLYHLLWELVHVFLEAKA